MINAVAAAADLFVAAEPAAVNEIQELIQEAYECGMCAKTYKYQEHSMPQVRTDEEYDIEDGGPGDEHIDMIKENPWAA